MKRFLSFQIAIVCFSTCFITEVYSQEMNAKANSYNMQVTANKDGTTMKFLSPETDVKNNYLKIPPQVMVQDSKQFTMLTPILANIMTNNPKMSVDGDLDPYTYKNAKTNLKIYKLVKVLHTNHDVEPTKTFAKGEKKESNRREDLVTKSIQHDEENDESSGIIDEGVLSGEGIQENGEIDDAESFPPKAPEIPIELGNTDGKLHQNSTNKIKEKMAPITNTGQQQEKLCIAATCVDNDGDTGNGEEGDDENKPQPDIPIELGLVDGKADDQYRVVDIDQKTPESFLMLLPDTLSSHQLKEEKRVRRSFSDEELSSSKRLLRVLKHLTRIGRHKKRSKIHRRFHEKKRSWKDSKRNNIDHGSVSKPNVQKPVEAYIMKLSKDLENIRNQAKRVLQNTDQVSNGLKRIVDGTSVLSSIASGAAKNAKFFRTSPQDSNMEYLHEQSIVALIAAKKASREAEESALVAKEASAKASETARRMSISRAPKYSTDNRIISGNSNQAGLTKSEASTAVKAASFAKVQMEKVQSISSFLNKTLKRMGIAINQHEKHQQNPLSSRQALMRTDKIDTTIKTGAKQQTQRDRSPDPEYEDFDESSRKASLMPKYNYQATQLTRGNQSPSVRDILDKRNKAAIRSKPVKPVHLVPGEYTGFKRSDIPDFYVPTFNRLKSFGRNGLNDDDDDDDDASNIHLQKSQFSFIHDSTSTTNSRSKTNATAQVETAKIASVVNAEPATPTSSGSDSSGSSESGEIEETGADSNEGNEEGADWTKLLAKAPISVDVHVSSFKDHGAVDSDDDVDGDNEDSNSVSAGMDPFGFTKNDDGVKTDKDDKRMRKNDHSVSSLDPFGFKQFQQEQDSAGVQDRKPNGNHQLNRREKTPAVVGEQHHLITDTNSEWD